MKRPKLIVGVLLVLSASLLRAQSGQAVPPSTAGAQKPAIEYVAFAPLGNQLLVGLRTVGGVFWATPGSVISGYNVEFIENFGEFVVVSKGGQVQKIGLLSAQVQGRADPFASLPHDLALIDAQGMVEAYRRSVTAMPGYRPYDPAIEKAYGPEFEKLIAERRASAPQNFFYAVPRAATSTGTNPHPGIVNFPSITTSKMQKRRYANLSASEIRQIDLDITSLMAVRFQLNSTAAEAASKTSSPDSK